MRALVFIFIIGLILSCDTERNIPLLPQDTFLKFYGVEGEQTGVDFVLTPDNALVMVGNSTQPSGMQMIYVVKVDLLGNVIWENMIGLSDKNNSVKDIELHPDGRLIIAGETEMAVGNRDVFLKTMSGDGIELDSARHDIAAGSDEVVKSVSIINTGLAADQQGFIVAGATTSIDTEGFYVPTARDITDAMHVRFTEIPSLQVMSAASWDTGSGKGDSEDIAVKVIRNNSNEFYCFGYSNVIKNGAGDFKFWIFSIDDFGEESGDADILLETLGLTSNDEILKSVIDVDLNDLFDRGYLLSGISRDNTGSFKPYLVKLRRTLDFDVSDVVEEVYLADLGTSSNSEIVVNSFLNTVTNEYFIISTQNRNPNLAEDLSLFKLNREIQPVWGPQVFGGESFDEAGAVLQLPDGKIMVLGTMTVGGLNGQKKMALMKLNSEGKLLR